MKIIKCFSAVLLATVIIGLSACKKDEDKEQSLLISKWKVLQSYDPHRFGDDYLVFKNDGTFEMIYASRCQSVNMSTGECGDDIAPEYSEFGKYRIESGDLLYMLYSDEDEWIMSKIVELNSISLIMEELYEDGTPHEYRESFQRVN